MSEWNGLALQTEFSTLLGDNSSVFKAKVLTWMNDIQMDIFTRHTWPFRRYRGQKVLTTGAEEHSVTLDTPIAPTVIAAAGGTLVNAIPYKVLVTFYESASKVESLAGTQSAAITPAAGNNTINLSAIPVSLDPLVTDRKVYLSKNGGNFYYYGSVGDNTTLTYSVSSDTTSTIEPPDYTYFDKIDGSPYFETSTQLNFKELDDLRYLFNGQIKTGIPYIWTYFNETKVVLYPRPSSALTLFFYYFKKPNRLVAEATCIPELPSQLKLVLKAGVQMLGHEYRERADMQIKRQEYNALLENAINEMRGAPNVSRRVRDINGSSVGWFL